MHVGTTKTQVLAVPLKVTANIREAELSSDGSVLVVLGEDGFVTIWNLAAGLNVTCTFAPVESNTSSKRKP